jgi:predicted AlkP superfamily phosphohydrolase/phosphomutase
VRLDAVIGRAVAATRAGDVLYVMSDHGFVPMYREFNLQTWLAEQGYLQFKAGSTAGEARGLEYVDWSRSRAYGLGFQSLYLNLKGREAAGIVEPADAGRVAGEIRDKLLALRDDDKSIFRGRAVFQTVYRPTELYSGPRAGEAPDLVLGYARGYGPSDDTVLGVAAANTLAQHLGGFSGHHTTDFGTVPGVLFCSQKLRARAARLEDLTVTILREVSAAVPDQMTGTPID